MKKPWTHISCVRKIRKGQKSLFPLLWNMFACDTSVKIEAVGSSDCVFRNVTCKCLGHRAGIHGTDHFLSLGIMYRHAFHTSG